MIQEQSVRPVRRDQLAQRVPTVRPVLLVPTARKDLLDRKVLSVHRAAHRVLKVLLVLLAALDPSVHRVRKVL